jgi:hypothetical protein
MTRDEWELQSAIDASVEKYYSEGYVQLTKREAVALIRANRDRYFPKPVLGQKGDRVKKQIFARSLSWSMIDILLESKEKDPVRIIEAYIRNMEEVQCHTRFPKNMEDWKFVPDVWVSTQHMADAARIMLDILKIKEKP